MKLRDYIGSLSPEQADEYAARCGTTTNYLTTHIRYATKEPSVKLIKALAQGSEGRVSMNEVLEHYGLLDGSSLKAS